MKIGLGLSGSQLNDDILTFAKQIGAGCIMLHMADPIDSFTGNDGYWSFDDLKSLVKRVETHGLKLEALENFQPAHWHEILLGTGTRQRQMDNLKRTIENMGRAGIPVMGYFFSVAGPQGRKSLPVSRGGAVVPVYNQSEAEDFDTPLPHGYAWARQIIENPPPGDQGFVSEEAVWERLDYFLGQILPVAEEFNVQLAAHPENPPIPLMRQTARPLISIEQYDRMFSHHNSIKNMVQYCLATFSQMPFGPEYVYRATEHFAEINKISYVHFSNSRGQIPLFQEEFADTGDVDMVRILKILYKHGYTGMLVPNHMPGINAQNSGESSSVYAIGYIRGLIQALDIAIDE